MHLCIFAYLSTEVGLPRGVFAMAAPCPDCTQQLSWQRLPHWSSPLMSTFKCIYAYLFMQAGPPRAVFALAAHCPDCTRHPCLVPLWCLWPLHHWNRPPRLLCWKPARIWDTHRNRCVARSFVPVFFFVWGQICMTCLMMVVYYIGQGEIANSLLRGWNELKVAK